MPIDTSKIELEENIPLTAEEKEKCLKDLEDYRKHIPLISGISTSLPFLIAIWVNNWKIPGGDRLDHTLFFASIGLVFLFVYGILRLFYVLQKNNLSKDFKQGKQILKSYVVGKGNTNHIDRTLTFILPTGKKLRLSATISDYKSVQYNDFVQVSFLRHDKIILKIEKLNEPTT